MLVDTGWYCDIGAEDRAGGYEEEIAVPVRKLKN